MLRKNWISWATLLALGVVTTGCNNGNSTSKKPEISTISFSEVAISKNDAEKKVMRVSPQLTVTYEDNSSKKYELNYKILAKMGDKIGNGTIGLITDKSGNPILKADGSKDISDGPDGNSLISVGGKNYLITHMEERPGELYHTELKLEKGKIKAIDTKPVDLSAMDGTIINCASTKTVYGSHLGGEEDYSLNTRYADKNSPFYVNCALDGNGNNSDGQFNYFCSYVDGLAKYLNDNNIDKNNGYNGESFSPYNYGYIVEVSPQSDGTTKSAKHYVTGKYTPELAAMMPDGKTVYMSDDGTFKGFWRFVSDKKIEKFSNEWEGTLYSAKLTQKSDKNGGSFDLSWIKLGHAKDSEIKALIKQKPKLTDMFEIKAVDENGTCDAGFKKINEDSESECLKLKSGKEKMAAFLETRKYAAYKDATIEFRKEEGLTYNPDKNVLYLAMSQIKKSMEDNYKGRETNNDIRLPKNQCGGVYELTLDNSYKATSMNALVVGKPLSEGDTYANEWACHPDAISNPDNITYIGNDILLISEDTTYHVNNMTWAYNTKTDKMTRIASLPIGGEVTGVDKGLVDDKGILLINTQHPFKDNPKAANGDKPNSALLENATTEELKAVIGYIDGMPSEIFK